MRIRIRPEQPEDRAGITALTKAAFAHAPHTSHTEHLIVDALRDAGQLTISLVAVDDAQQLTGHVALSPVTVSDGTAHWYGLGPLSVAPAQQRHGIGSALMHAALDTLRQQGAGGCVLLGDPGYYARFGFTPRPGLILPGVPPEYFQALCLAGALPAGEVRYHPAFDVTA